MTDADRREYNEIKVYDALDLLEKFLPYVEHDYWTVDLEWHVD